MGCASVGGGGLKIICTPTRLVENKRKRSDEIFVDKVNNRKLLKVFSNHELEEAGLTCLNIKTADGMKKTNIKFNNVIKSTNG